MRISDWSSDVCSSDLIDGAKAGVAEFLVRIAIDLHRQNVTPLALTYARLSTFLAPENSETWLVTRELLAAREQRQAALERSEARREGKEWFRRGRFGWAPYH